MAVQEFEAWLIADIKTVRTVLAATVPTPSPPESMPCRQAKETLADWLGKARPADESRAWDKAQRSYIADQCDLAVVARACPSFDAFLRAL